jgi:hypothetical protein
MSWKLAYHHDEDGQEQPGSPNIEYLVGCILNGFPVRVLVVRLNDVLVYDTITVCVNPSSVPRAVSALLPFQPAMKESCELNQVFGMSAIAIDTTGRYSQIDSSSRGRLSEDFFEMKWFVDE